MTIRRNAVKVAFESQLLLKGNKTGIGWCADNLIRGLAKEPDVDCQMNYFSKGVEPEKLDSLKEYTDLGITLNASSSWKATWYKLVWPFLKIPYHWFFGDKTDITQFFNYVIPPGVKGKKVTIVHDMAHLACRDTVRRKTRWWLDLTLKQSCRRADLILTVSEFSKSEIIKYLNMPEEKVRVMYPGVDLELFHPGYPDEQVQRAKKKYGIDGDYILYLGTIEPRKNIQRLIEAYDKLVTEGTVKNLPRLVLAGGRGWLCDDIYKAAEKASLRDKVQFTGYVDEEDIPLLLTGAEFLAFPSVYEGFGTPPVEALACGTPVLTANVASMPEVLREHAVYADPYSTDSIAEKIHYLHEHAELRERMKQEGPEYVKRYNWKNSVRALKQIYLEMMGK